MKEPARVIEYSEQQPPTSQIARAVAASVFGWALDLFDLFIVLYLAPYIREAFFPSQSPTLSLAAVYAAFAVSLVMRPAGSALFGWFADSYGRKRAMVMAVFGVGAVTAMMGAVPTTETIGLLAPAVFVLLRLIQGIFVGGVVASTHTIGIETVPPHWRGMLSGLVGAGGAGLAGLCAAGVFYILSALIGSDSFASWGWRLMFFTGIITSFLGLFAFGSLEESPLWSTMQRTSKGARKAPLKTLLSARYAWVLLSNILFCAGGATQYYLTSGFLPTFLAVVNHLPKTKIGAILALNNFFVLLTGPLFGHLSEYLGRRGLFIIAGFINLVGLPLIYSKLALFSGPMEQFGTGCVVLVVLLAVLGNAVCAPIIIFLNERFPTEIRATGTGVSWNVGFAIGGTMPTFVMLASREITNLPHSLMLFLMGGAVACLVAALMLPETHGDLT
jgi:MHS family proline/betaine transporter-like MFS transporter